LKKQLFALALVLALLPTPALAAGSADNFVRSKTYTGQFSDVAEGSVFHDNIAALYEYGATVGKGGGLFGPADPVSVGQAVIFAARIRSLYDTGDAEAGPSAFKQEGMAAYEPYLLYLQSLGVLGNELDGGYPHAAPRKTAAHILARALPEGALEEVNGDLVAAALADQRYITDVGEGTQYREDILALYRWGILQGSGGAGDFLPEENISRGALAAMLTRIMDPSLRVTPAWDVGLGTTGGTSWGSLVPKSAYIAAPATYEEIEADVAYMLGQERNTLTLQYPGIALREARSVMNQALAAAKKQVEQCYNTVECAYDTAGRLTLTFGAVECPPEQLEAYRAYTLDAAVAVRDGLWESGALTEDMSQRDMAKVYFDWVCENCVYDDAAGRGSLSHIAYALFHDGVAVCDGYTGAYNLLLKLEGISCYAQTSSTHIWTVAELDGQPYHIDTTWGDDPEKGPDYHYFAMTEEQARAAHDWV